MFGRKGPEAERPSVDEAAPGPAGAQAPKGRPTPSRRESEAARRDSRRIPSDPKAARKAAKARAKAERATARNGMMQGDARYLPARDRGPVRAFVRDWIDRRRRLSEYFIFIALGILFAGFIPSPEAQFFVSTLWFSITIIVAVEIAWTLLSLNRALKQRWPDKAERKGTMFYGGMRSLQIRRLRIPPPTVKPSLRPAD